MLLRRVSVIAAIALSIGGTIALANSNLLYPQKLVAQTPTPTQPNRPERGRARLQELNLRPEQTQQLNAIREQYKGQIQQRKSALRTAKQEFAALMAGSASESEIRAKHQQVETLQQQLSETSFESMLAMRRVLDPAQRQKLAQLTQQRRQNRQPRQNRRQGQGQDFMIPAP